MKQLISSRDVLLNRKIGSAEYWYGKGEFPRIKIFKTQICVLISMMRKIEKINEVLTNSNLSPLKYWYETTY